MSAAASLAPGHALAAPAPRLLLIDDAPQDLSELSRLLARHFRLQFATEGLTGFHRAQSQQPDLILLDVGLPDLDGMAVCRLLHAEAGTRRIPVIFLSAHASAEERVQGLEAGAVDYVGKPCLAAEVLARVNVNLRRGLVQQEAAQGQVLPGDPALLHLRAAVTLIRQQIAALPSVRSLARQVGLSERRLSELFRQHLGTTISGYISEERIRVGSRLLAETAMPVSAISVEVGFLNATNFSAAFRERMGMPPLAWRQMRQGAVQ